MCGLSAVGAAGPSISLDFFRPSRPSSGEVSSPVVLHSRELEEIRIDSGVGQNRDETKKKALCNEALGRGEACS
ncbi:hypothetical protein E2C01_060274 [Portunus trituberculatus]|uniref:Uncharacterized protein n=1 Tax=Portunus trituberculatus TaxID=210409 RepID=A0A5B7H8F2_PORTR|nr:hypothetical protein [Portunus trituberculatus]